MYDFNQKITDEAWTWRRALWAEGVCQLVACAIRQIWPELHGSFPYYRTEPDRGRWMVAPCGAGPFKTPNGPMFIVDFHDFESLGKQAVTAFFSEQKPIGTIGALGCDLALWWPEKNEFVAIWSVLWTGTDDAWQAQLSRAASAIQRFSTSPEIKSKAVGRISGIAIGTSAIAADVEVDSGQSGSVKVTGLRMPMRIDTQDVNTFRAIISNLRAGIEIAFGEMSQ